MQPRYPEIEVKLVGEDGNAFAIVGRVTNALKKNGVPADEIKKFTDEAFSGPYDNLLQAVMRWVETS